MFLVGKQVIIINRCSNPNIYLYCSGLPAVLVLGGVSRGYTYHHRSRITEAHRAPLTVTVTQNVTLLFVQVGSESRSQAESLRALEEGHSEMRSQVYLYKCVNI